MKDNSSVDPPVYDTISTISSISSGYESYKTDGQDIREVSIGNRRDLANLNSDRTSMNMRIKDNPPTHTVTKSIIFGLTEYSRAVCMLTVRDTEAASVGLAQ